MSGEVHIHLRAWSVEDVQQCLDHPAGLDLLAVMRAMLELSHQGHLVTEVVDDPTVPGGRRVPEMRTHAQGHVERLAALLEDVPEDERAQVAHGWVHWPLLGGA